jgi:predicted TIM-barrel fold metal-dependent hydrolase
MNTHRRNFILGSAGLMGLGLSGCAGIRVNDSVFDAHCHIIDPRFPLIANQGYTPPFFTLDDYRKATIPLGITSGAIVSGSFQGLDQSYLKTVLSSLGSQWVGVTQVPAEIPDQDIADLSKIGVKALRFNLFRGRIDNIDEIVMLAQRAHAAGHWHAEIYADAAALAPHVTRLSKLPKIVIDHLGMNEKGLPVILDLVDAGACIKATGFGRVDMNVPRVLEKIAERNPNALVFGTDLPSTRAKRPFATGDLELIRKVLGAELARKALWSNARALYRLPASS